MLHVVKAKRCKRCGGDLFLERDSDGVYIACLQCGAAYIEHGKEEKKDNKKIPAR